MGNKRQKTNVQTLIPQKKLKHNENEFNGTVFKSTLKDPSNAFKALEKFIQIARKLPCDDVYDVVEGYIKISAECAEILALLEGETPSETELMLIFQSLESVLLRTASDLSHFNMVGSSIVRKVVSSHMKLLQSCLYSGNRRFVRQCLCLLTAMVSQGTEAACEIFNSLVFNQSLKRLARMRDKTGRPDVRMSYVQFALSFLLYGDTGTIGNVLDTKDFLLEILNTGLKEDRISTVSLILSTFQSKIVLNNAVSKTQKLRFFTVSTLSQIASLYRWTGTLDVSTDHSVEEGRLVVRESVHSFLLDLCCSRKHGISFHDPSLGTAKRAGNIVLLQFAVSLKQANKDEKVSELLVNMLKCNPDILQRYFIETQLCFTPRMNEVWLDSIALLKRIFQSQPEVSQAFELQEVVPVHRLLSMVLVTSLPSVCNKAFFTQGLNLPLVAGQHATLTVMALILRRAQRNIEHSLKKSAMDSLEKRSINSKAEFVQLYREALSKVLPDIMSIVSKWQSLSKTGKKGGDQNQKLTQLKSLLLQVICLYQKVVPHLVIETRFDFSKLLKGVVSEGGIKEDVPPILQCLVLQLALELPTSKFSWFRFQDVAAPECEGREQSVLCVLLKMFVNNHNPHLRTTTKMLVIKVLKESGAFEHNWTELELWLNQLLHLEPSQQETVIQFLDSVLLKVVLNPCLYMDKVAVMVQEAVCLQVKIRGQDKDTSVPVSHIDDVSDVTEVINEASEKDADNIGCSLTDDIILQMFPFSAAVPAVLEARNKQQAALIDQKSVLCEYVSAVLSKILHTQRDPLALCLILNKYDTELYSSENCSPPHSSISDFRLYYLNWLPHPHQEIKVDPMDLAASPPVLDFSAYLRVCYCEGADSFLQESFWERLDQFTLDLSEFIGAVSQTLLYLNSLVESFCMLPKARTVEVVVCLLKVLHTLFNKLYSTTETPHTPPVPSEEEDFFLDISFTANQEGNRKQVLLDVFRLVFKHPVLQQWFFALEMQSMASHTLEPERMVQLCGPLTQGVVTLLSSCVETLKAFDALEVVSPFLLSVQQVLLSELKQSNRCAGKSAAVEAFLVLYEYMDPSSAGEVLSALLLLPQSDLSPGGDEINLYGRAVVSILTKNISPAWSVNIIQRLSQAHMRSLAALHSSCYNSQLEDICVQVLQREPVCAKLIPTDILLHCLRGSSVELAALLVQNCSTHCLTFELWCLEQTDLLHITAQNSSFLSLLSVYLQKGTTGDPCRSTDIQREVLQMLTKVLLPELSSSVLKLDIDVPLELCVETLSSLIPVGASASDLHQLIQDLPVLLQEPKTGDQRWQLADVITEKLAGTPEQIHWRNSLLTAALRWLSATYKDHKQPLVEREEAMIQRLKTLLISPENITEPDWNSFVKTGLKYRYKDRMFLFTLNSFLELMLKSVLPSKGLLPIETLHMMVTSHSLFLPTMFAPPDDKDSKVKFHKAQKSLGPSLWQQLSSESLLDQLIGDRMLNTVAHFPLHHFLIPQEDEELISTEEQRGRPDELYDPSFLIPLFSYIVRPEEHMYLVVSKFLSGTQYVDLKRVPDFFRLFYSFDLEHKLERSWLLKMLEEGMRDGLCYEICEQQNVFQTLLGFSSSPLSNQPVQIQMLNVLLETARLPKASFDFSKAHGMLTWITQLIESSRSVDRRMLSIVIELLYVLWNSSAVRWSTETPPRCNSLDKPLPFSILNDFLCVLLSLIKHLRSGLDPSELERLLRVLDSVLNHGDSVLNGNGDVNWLRPPTLSCSAVLTLLHCWGNLTSENTLLRRLREIFDTYSIKVYHGTLQEDVQEAIQSQDKHTENHGQCLVKCKTLLLSVLTHWEPQTVSSQKSDQNLNASAEPPPPDHSSHPPAVQMAGLMTATAHTLISWMLHSLSDGAFDECRTFATLKWLEKLIVPHEVIAKSLLKDEAVKVDLLRFYHQTCEFQLQERNLLRLDTLHLFTTIMVKMLTVEKSLHTNVLKVCLLPATDDPVRRDLDWIPGSAAPPVSCTANNQKEKKLSQVQNTDHANL
ncbi:Nucleolar pre-ribosomal-associated protein 1 [Bagarius yarrelli]|uniref:Nucleolar pre-ribosomal-associated protein 1 n=1 Tax=Bagarius yarrelli TaxID=175774 RepID=A0A556VB68_BAGYA|nr:Nucleolar pre-ribosomal-associated protein 1 [Bagarius yarrelli]